MQLGEKGDALQLDKPVVDASFERGGNEATATLTWPEHRIAFLLKEAVSEFELAFGEGFARDTSWTIVTADDLAGPDGLVRLIRERG